MDNALSIGYVLDITLSAEFAYLDHYFKEETFYQADKKKFHDIIKNDADGDLMTLGPKMAYIAKFIHENYDANYVIIDSGRKTTSMLITALRYYGITPLFKIYSGYKSDKPLRGCLGDFDKILNREDCNVSAIVLANNPIINHPSNLCLIDVTEDEVFTELV